jgi:hypothetical protein
MPPLWSENTAHHVSFLRRLVRQFEDEALANVLGYITNFLLEILGSSGYEVISKTDIKPGNKAW